MQKKQLTISVLVSGRKDTTEKCLDSLKNLRGQLDCELILVDTGCDEKLRQVVERYTDQVIDFTWCDDFAKARNCALEKANGEWFLYLDDDEWFEDTEPIVSFLQSEESREYDQAVYKARNYSNKQGTKYTDEWVSRMIRLQPDTRFVGKVHEYLSPARGKCRQIDAYVHHYGYAFQNAADKEKHFRRNEPLVLEMIAQEPGNMQWRTQLVQEYASVKDAQKLRGAAEEALQMIAREDQFSANQCRGAFYSAVIISYFLEENYKEAYTQAAAFLEDGRNSTQCRCSLLNYAAESAFKIAEYHMAEQYAMQYMELYTKLREQPETDEQKKIILDSIIFVKDAISEDVYHKNLLYWTVCMIRQEKSAEIGPEQTEQVQQYIDVLLQGNGDFLRMPEQVWEIGRARVVDLEEMLLQLDFSQWIAAVTVVASGTTPAELKRMEKQIRGIQTKENIRYSYYRMRFADILVLVEEEGQAGYVDLRNHFAAFASTTLEFYQQIYRPEAFEGEMEMLPDHCRAAVWAQRMLDCGGQEWEEMLRCLRKCARAYPQLGEIVKKFADLIGKEQEQAAEEAQAASEELQAMVLQVKPKIMVMLEHGMTAEAYQVVQQLRQMLPDHPEVEKLDILVRSKLM